MNLAKKVIKNKRICLIIFIIVFIISFHIFIKSNNKALIIEIGNNINILKTNYIFNHNIILLISMILNIILLGMPFISVVLMYELISIIYLIISFTMVYGFKGLIFILVYLLLTKFIYIFSMILLNSKYYRQFKLVVKSINNRKINLNIMIIYKYIIIIILFNLIYEFLLNIFLSDIINNIYVLLK